MADVTLNESTGSMVGMKLQATTWELNIWAPAADFVRLHAIKDADWAMRRPLAIGTCADANVYWTPNDDQPTVTVLIGHDGETWDAAVIVPLETVHEIASLAAAYGGSRSAAQRDG
ncbi:MAG: hypothetical protein ACRDOO_13565 [Actinomadura sp.]